MTVFQSKIYRDTFRRVFGAGKRFFVLEGPGGAIWLQKRGILARRVEFWGQGIADCGGLYLERPDNAPALWEKLERFVAQNDGAVLAQLSADSPLVALAQNGGWNVEDAEVCPVLEFPATWDDYVRGLGKNMREQIRRYPKRLDKQFKVEYSLAQTPAQVRTALDDLFVLHGKRWRERGQTGVLALPSRQRFHRLLCQGLLRRDQLRLWSLHCDGKPACVLLCYVFEHRYYFFIGGFEPDLMRWSVGTCLFARVFRHAIEEGAREFDFLRGAEGYKYRFGAVDRPYVTLSRFAPTFRGRILRKQVALEAALMKKLHEKFSAAHANDSSHA